MVEPSFISEAFSSEARQGRAIVRVADRGQQVHCDVPLAVGSQPNWTLGWAGWTCGFSGYRRSGVALG